MNERAVDSTDRPAVTRPGLVTERRPSSDGDTEWMTVYAAIVPTRDGWKLNTWQYQSDRDDRGVWTDRLLASVPLSRGQATALGMFLVRYGEAEDGPSEPPILYYGDPE